MRSRISGFSGKTAVSSECGTSIPEYGLEERGKFAGLLGDIFQALDRLEYRNEEECHLNNHGISVRHVYLDDIPLLCFGSRTRLAVL